MTTIPYGLLLTFILSIGYAQQVGTSEPNLLFIMMDQQRFDALSSAGNLEIRTPNLDRIASEGVLFKSCYCGNPVCVPSRSIMLTGRSSDNINVTKNGHIDSNHVPNVPTFDSILSDNGYTSEYYGKWHAPYKFAASYDNDVRTLSGNTKDYQDWLLAQGVEKKSPGIGQLYNKRSKRPYEPIELDGNYDLAFTAKTEEKMNLNANQATQLGRMDLPANISYSAWTTEEALDALDRLQGGPFSLTCSFGPPHPPIVVQEPFYSMFPANRITPPASINDPLADSPYAYKADDESEQPYKDPKNIKVLRQIYYGMVREVDGWIGKILDRLDALGLTENTLIVFTSDHGEMLGDHGLHSKFIFYEGSVRVPLLMRFPGKIKPGTVVEEPVSAMDIFPTILDYMGIPIPQNNGKSLRTFVDGEPVPHDVVSAASGSGKAKPNYMIVSGDLKLMVYHKGPSDIKAAALYDLRNDPMELTNLVNGNPQKVQVMMAKFVSWLQKHEPERAPIPVKEPTTQDPTLMPTEEPTTPEPTPMPTEDLTTPEPIPMPTEEPTTLDPSEMEPTTPEPTPMPMEDPASSDPTRTPKGEPTPMPMEDPASSDPPRTPKGEPTPMPMEDPASSDPTRTPKAEPTPMPMEDPASSDPTRTPTEEPTVPDPTLIPTEESTTPILTEETIKPTFVANTSSSAANKSFSPKALLLAQYLLLRDIARQGK